MPRSRWDLRSATTEPSGTAPREKCSSPTLTSIRWMRGKSRDATSSTFPSTSVSPSLSLCCEADRPERPGMTATVSFLLDLPDCPCDDSAFDRRSVYHGGTASERTGDAEDHQGPGWEDATGGLGRSGRDR